MRPDCRLLAKKPGVVHVTASHKALATEPKEVRIAPAAADFQRLVLALDSSPLAPGQSRRFAIWGYPQDGAARQDLTASVSNDPAKAASVRLKITTLEPSSGTAAAELRQGALIALVEGRISVQAIVGEGLTSDPVELQIANVADTQPVAIRIVPPQLTVTETERAPITLSVQVRSRGSSEFHEVADAKLESLDQTVLSPLADNPRQFKALRAGTASVRASVGNLTAFAEVHVAADRFASIVPTLGDVRQQQFNFDMVVTCGRSGKDAPEYRVLAELDAQDKTPWTPAELVGEKSTVKLTSPYLPLLEKQRLYRVYIQARDRNQPDKVEVYPYWVKFDLSKAC